MKIKISIVSVCIVSFFHPLIAYSEGANIPEDMVSVVYYVNNESPSASDGNAGTDPALPLLTVQRGIEKAMNSITAGDGVKVCIFPGTYREELDTISTRRGQPLIIEGTNIANREVVISGSEVITSGWISAAVSGVFQHVWTYDWGYQTNNTLGAYKGLATRREMIFINNKLLLQKEDLNELVPGSFYVDEEADLLYVKPPHNTDMSAAFIESAIRKRCVRVDDKPNVIFRNITVQHYNLAIWMDAVPENAGYMGWGTAIQFRSVTNCMIDSCTFRFNNSSAIALYKTTSSAPLPHHITITNCIFIHNGGGGLYPSGWHYEMTDVKVIRSNWRGLLNWYTGWSQCGLKVSSLHHANITRFHTSGNFAIGFWNDTDISNVVFDSCNFSHNYSYGTFIEKVQGPLIMKNMRMTGNASGIEGADSMNVTISHSEIFGNGRQIECYKNYKWTNGYINIDSETGEPVVTKLHTWTITNNNLAGWNPHQRLYWAKWYDPPDERFWRTNIMTLVSDHNTWFNSVDTNMFYGPDLTGYTFTQWQNTTGRFNMTLDTHSTYAKPEMTDYVLNDKNAYWEFWNETDGTLTGLLTHPHYPDNPDGVYNSPWLQSTRNFGIYYGARCAGWLSPPTSGWYRFWIAGNDECCINMNTNGADSMMLTRIAENNSLVYYNDFDNSSSQMSDALWLKGDTRYYMEILLAKANEATDSAYHDYCSVAWQLPWVDTRITKARETIPSEFFEPLNPVPEPIYILVFFSLLCLLLRYH